MAAAASQRVAGFITDVEGNLEYFQRCVDLSSVLDYADDNRTQLRLAAHAEFVYGGDVCDKGIGDIRVTRQLVALKREHPERVHLILGNRDLNKLRLATELSAAAIAEPAVVADASHPAWVPHEQRVPYASFLQQLGGPEHNSLPNRLRWLLAHTMGADGMFERRRAELAAMMEVGATGSVTDDAVVDSYQRQVDPAGADGAFHLDFLRLGQLAYAFGSVVFVHGGVTTANMGWVPGKPDHVADARAWVAQLNSWAAAQLAQFCSAAPGESQLGPRAATALMDYGLPGGNDSRTVVYSSYLVDGNGVQQPAALCEYLCAAGINTVVSGHTPHGDAPNPMDTQAAGGSALRVLSADTSYSQAGAASAWGVDNRGAAAAAVEVCADGRVAVRGVLSDGRLYAYQMAPPGEAGPTLGCDGFVGRQLVDGRWVKALLGDGDGDEGEAAEYLLVKGQGFTLAKSFASRAELAAQSFV